jgi:hypothetical protein
MFLQCLDDMLLHHGQLRKLAKNGFGSVTTVTTIVTVACYVYEDTKTLKLTDARFTQPLGWCALFPASVLSQLAINDQLVAVTDAASATIISTAVITDIHVYRHWAESDIVVVGELKVG